MTDALVADALEMVDVELRTPHYDPVAVVVSDDHAVRADELPHPDVARERVELESERPAAARR